MEPLAFMDDLLDFDVGEEDDEEEGPRKSLSYKLKPTGIHDADDPTRLFPELPEELEWLSNKDAFPTVETFVDILSDQYPRDIPKHQSPVSVLENTSSSNSSNANNKNSTLITSCCGGLKVPVRARSKFHRKRRRDIPSQQLWYSQPVNNKLARVEPIIANSSSIGRKCQHCGAEKTPQWRAGPFGPKTLCNACGVRYKSGRLVPEYRPANSPTFSCVLHSNSHRKVMEMRRKKQVGMTVKAMDKG